MYLTTYSTSSASKTPTAETKKYYVYQSKEFNFNSSFINRYQDTTSGGVIKIRADSPVSVLTVYEMSSYKVVNPILPTNALSTTYIIPSYTPNTFTQSGSQFLVISLNDTTEIRFEGYETGNMVYPLNKEEIFIYERLKDISSTSAKSNLPFSIFTSVLAGNLHTTGSKYSVYLSMQVPPIDRHAIHFIVPPLEDDFIKHYRVRIYASAQNAFIEIHSNFEKTQKVHVYHKIFYELTTDCSDIVEIVSNAPLVVVQIALDALETALFMMNIPATSQFLDSYATSGLDGKHWNPSNMFIITIPFSEASGLIINRRPITHDPTQIAEQTPLGNYTVLSLRTHNTHSTITHVNSVPFGLLVVGQWSYNSDNAAYGFQAGMQLTKDCKTGISQTDVSGSLVG